MLFTSIKFVLFTVAVFFLYYFPLKGKTKLQNVLLLIASYLFYAFANWKILPLLILSTAIFYALGLAIFKEKNERKRSLFTTLGVVLALGALIYFKYTNFFIDSFKTLFENIGMQSNLQTLNLIVPVGISFYTFRLLSYLIDINRGKYGPTKNFVDFATYVAFFPCILSGPIDRPNTFIPQLQSKRTFNYQNTVEGLRNILLGLFKKMVIADHCANIVNSIFQNYESCTSGTLIMGAVLFTFQIYTDFSGYTDMAIGVSKLFGFNVTQNFNRPFFSQNIAEYWRKWHISLTSWLTDYVFMPLNIKWRDLGNGGMILAIMITFILIGLWHGANWTFALFGLYHGLLYIPLILSGAMFKKSKLKLNKIGLPTAKIFGKMLLTFFLVAFGLIIFKANTIEQAYAYIGGIFSFAPIENAFSGWNPIELKYSIYMIIGLMIYEYLIEIKKESLNLWFNRIPEIFRWGVYLVLILGIVYLGVYGSGNDNNFIYFKF